MLFLGIAQIRNKFAEVTENLEVFFVSMRLRKCY